MTFAEPNNLLILLFALPLVWFIGWPTRPFRRSRDVLSLILRTVIVVLIVFALSGLQVVQSVEKLAVMFLVDASDSVGVDVRSAQIAYIQDAVNEKPTEDEWGVILFGTNATIDRSLSAIDEVLPVRSTVATGHTNLADAMQKAIAVFPADARRRIVILSDGEETLGNAETIARRAEASGIEISYVPFYRDEATDARVVNLTAPARVSEGQEFDVSVTVESDTRTDANLIIFSGGRIVQERPVTLEVGRTSYTITQRSEQSGFLNFSARLELPSDADNFSQNNQLATFSQVVGPPRVMIISENPADIEHLLPALENAGVTADVRAPGNLPADTATLADYKSILIVNVPAERLSTQQMQRLDSYVKDLGGGLIMIGGPDSFGPGGYYETPLEQTLPVEMQIKDQQRLPRLTIAYLVDSSGSMAATDASGIAYLDLAKRAINISVDLLMPTDRAAVGTFDVGGAWVIPFQDVEDKRQIQALVDTLRPGGGTDIGSGLSLVEQDIVNEPTERKHLILMTDGGSNPRGLVDRAAQLYEQHGVTMSVIAIGGGVPDFLEGMAIAGNGQYYRVTDISEIPRIFAQETVLASRTFIEEGDFNATQAALSPIMDGFDALPPYSGYVATTLKDTAQAVLRGPEPYSDPLLATWQYGLGRAVAFTSDATGRWATEWVTWDGFSRWWGQVVGWSITESAANNIETRVVIENDRARIIVDARADDGAFLNNLQLAASIVNPANDGQTIPLQQVAPGQYEATFTPSAEGSYFIAINGEGTVDGAPVTFNEVNGWVLAYSPEYIQSPERSDLMVRIAEITGGQSLTDDPALAFAPADDARTAATPIFPYLLVIALLLLPADIAMRRIIITRSDWQRLRAALGNRGESADAAHTERMSSLMSARERARSRHTADEDSDAESSAPSRRSKSGDDQAARPTIRPSYERKREPVRSGEGSTVGALLKRRRSDDADES